MKHRIENNFAKAMQNANCILELFTHISLKTLELNWYSFM